MHPEKQAEKPYPAENPLKKGWKTHFLLCATLFLVTAGLYANTLGNDFLWDDDNLITQNQYIREIKNIPLFFTVEYWEHLHPFAEVGIYRPIRATSFALDYAIWGMNPAGFHLGNLVINAINSIAVYFLAIVLFPYFLPREKANALPEKQSQCLKISPDVHIFHFAFLTALIFSVFPLHTESVDWIKNRSEILMFLFFVSSCIFFIKALSSGEIRSRVLFLIFSVFFACLAALTKEITVVLPLVLTAFVFVFVPKKKLPKAIVFLLPFFVITGILFFFRVSTSVPLVQKGGITPMDHLLNPLHIAGNYLDMLILPIFFNAERALKISNARISFFTLYSLLLVCGYFYLLYFTRKKRWNPAFFALIWIGITLLPLFPVYAIKGRTIAESRLYLPSFGFSLFCAFLILQYLRHYPVQKKKGHLAMAILFPIMASFFASLIVRRNLTWNNPETFWLDCIEKSPSLGRPYYNLAVYYGEQKKYILSNKYYFDALFVDPNYPGIHNNLANNMKIQGRHYRAITHYLRSIQEEESMRAYSNIGNILVNIGKETESLPYFYRALDLGGDYALAHNNLGNAYEILGKLEMAVRHYDKAISIMPEMYAPHYNLGNVALRKNRFEEAVRHFVRALEISPDSASAQNNLGVAYNQLGMTDMAVVHLKAALELDPVHTDALNNMGLIHKKRGELPQALHYFQKLLQVSPKNLDAAFNIAEILRKKRNIESALTYYKRTLSINPYFEEARNQASVLSEKISLLHEKIRRVEKEIRNQPENAALYYHLANLFYDLGKDRKAIREYEKALEIEPKYLHALNRLSLVFTEKNNYGKALEYIKKMIEINPGVEEFYYNAACLYARKKDPQNALLWLNRAYDKGYRDRTSIVRDKDLDCIRHLPEYRNLIRKLYLPVIEEGNDPDPVSQEQKNNAPVAKEEGADTIQPRGVQK